jgi:hypothetical protein
MKASFTWVVSPEIIAKNIKNHGRKIEVAIYAIAQHWGQQIQNNARMKVDSEHKWQTRTGAAQGGLFFAVEGFGFGEVVGEISPKAKALMDDVEIVETDRHTLIITLGHTVYYGKYLELSNGGAHAVIMSTIEENLPVLDRMMKNALS